MSLTSFNLKRKISYFFNVYLKNLFTRVKRYKQARQICSEWVLKGIREKDFGWFTPYVWALGAKPFDIEKAQHLTDLWCEYVALGKPRCIVKLIDYNEEENFVAGRTQVFLNWGNVQSRSISLSTNMRVSDVDKRGTNDRWGTFAHELAHLRTEGHGRPFALEMAKVKLFLEEVA